MTIIGIALVLALIGLFLVFRESDTPIICGIVILAVSGLALFIVALSVPSERLEIQGKITEFKSIEASVSLARGQGRASSERLIENAALQQKIVEANAWLARKQYWNQTLFDIWIPDKVDQLKPIE